MRGSAFVGLKGKRGKRLGIADKVIEAGGDPRVVAALAKIVKGLRVGKSVPDPVAFMAEVANGLTDFTSEDLASVAEDMCWTRSQ